MGKNRPRIIIISIFLIVISALALNFVSDSGIFPGTSDNTANEKVSIDLVTVKTIETEIKKDESSLTEYVNYINTKVNKLNVSKMRDPFVLKKKPVKLVEVKQSDKDLLKQRRPDIDISGIVWDKNNPYAIINGDIYEIGDELGTYTVHTILDSMIVLSNDHDIYSIQFMQE